MRRFVVACICVVVVACADGAGTTTSTAPAAEPASTTRPTVVTTTTSVPPTTSTTVPETTTTTVTSEVPAELLALIGAPMPEVDLTIEGPEDVERWISDFFLWENWVVANPEAQVSGPG
ncbi:MAG: hypothetical protein HKN46_01905, partial [Acidimicrobiia bacterium]|nr:hypothetical protein [Acidimicrobiia bacterium]